ncbi:MAG: SpoIIIAH-like family protein [Oscillospiraceae bacterium]|nr:SpoIIIAH-like family protein [Oscillospiraceae bacterium]
MKKPTVIIGKKQILLSALTLLLGGAVYLNYVLADGNGLLDPTLLRTDPDAVTAAEADDLANYGTAEMVSAAASKSDYFAQARLDRQSSRDYAVQTLQSILGGGDLSKDEMVTNAIDAVNLSKQSEKESVIENLILSQGFSDCVVYLDGQTAKVVVESSGLKPEQAAAIKEIVLSESDVAAEGIRIFEVASGEQPENMPAP